MADIVYKAAATASLFHRSKAFVRAIRGPIGTGKSVTCCMEIIRRGAEQEAFEGVRKSRWAAIRNTYPELTSTTIKTWQDWAGEDRAPMSWDAPITSNFRQTLKDGTTVEIEVMFISQDRPADVKKLKSLDLTGVWLNEVSEMPKAVLDMATGRVGRYPSKAQGGATWSGVIMDTNSPDEDHWYYDLAEVTRPDGYEFFAQPGALLKMPDGSYAPNPDAENVNHHTLGYDYWLRQVPGKADQWIKVFLLGQYGSVHDGKPVYPEWNDSLHVKEIYPIQGVQLKIGVDFGLTPAAIITQNDAKGRLLILDEICSDDMGFRQFLEDLLIPYLMVNYPTHWAKKDDMVVLIADPAGDQRAQSDEKSCFMEAKAKQLKIRAAKSNAWLPRRGAVAWFLSKLTGGQPMLLLDTGCTTLRKGFNGGYKYRRIQVTGEERYTEEPMKNRYSHCFTAETLVSTPSGDRRIDELMVGDLVSTPDGRKEVTATMGREVANTMLLEFDNGRTVECTPDHPFLVGGKKIRADSLQYNDVLQCIGRESWADPQNTRFRNSTASSFIESLLATTSRITSKMVGATCTALFGRTPTDQCRKNTISIIGTKTRATMRLETLSAFRHLNMPVATGVKECQKAQMLPDSTWSAYDLLHRLGMVPMLAVNGTQNMGSAHGMPEQARRFGALTAGLSFQHWSVLRNVGSALRHVSLLLVGQVGLMMNRGLAVFAATSSRSINTPRREHVARLVRRSSLVGQKEVFDLTIQDAHCFYAAGVLVSNCHDGLQYVAMESGGIQAVLQAGRQPTGRVKSFAPSVQGMGTLGG